MLFSHLRQVFTFVLIQQQPFSQLYPRMDFEDLDFRGIQTPVDDNSPGQIFKVHEQSGWAYECSGL